MRRPQEARSDALDLRYPTYAVRAPLYAWLAAEGRQLAERYPAGYRLLDVGCGAMPYAALFPGADYVGLDFVPNPLARLEGRAEALPVEDASFDVVVCTQVLEHAEEPARVVAELRRATRPGGRVLASTHGVQPYHPSPDGDYWRWTHAGLERLFTTSASWRSCRVEPGSGTTACVGMVVGFYVDLLGKRLRLRWLSPALVAAINRLAAALDARSPRLFSLDPGSLIANYHVRADA